MINKLRNHIHLFLFSISKHTVKIINVVIFFYEILDFTLLDLIHVKELLQSNNYDLQDKMGEERECLGLCQLTTLSKFENFQRYICVP